MVRRSTCARPRKPVFRLCTTIPPSVINTAAPMPRINSSPELKQRAIVSPDSSAWVATASPSEGEEPTMLTKLLDKSLAVEPSGWVAGSGDLRTFTSPCFDGTEDRCCLGQRRRFEYGYNH